MSTTYRLHPQRYKIGEMEQFYSRMAAKGLHLTNRGAFVSTFEKGEPTEMKYRIEVVCLPKGAATDKMPEEQLAVYEDCGWEFVTKDSYIHIFRAPRNSDTEEFYLDPAQQAETLKHMKNNLLVSALQLPFYIVFYTMLNLLTGKDLPAMVFLSFMTNTYEIGLLLILLVRAIISNAWGHLRLSKLYRSMKKGIPLDHSPRKGNLVYLPFGPLAWCTLFFVLLYMFTKPGILKPLSAADPYITLQELGLRETVEYDTQNCYQYHKSPLCQYWDSEEIYNGEWIFADTFLLENEKHSEKVADALKRTTIFGSRPADFKEVVHPAMDKVWIVNDLELVAIKDNKVARIITIMDKEGDMDKILTALGESWENF